MQYFSKFLSSKKGRKVLNYAYSWGACLVILGALFKISHYPYDDLFLLIGMGTEVIVFFISGFESPEVGYKWDRVFPQLRNGSDKYENIENISVNSKINESIADMENKIDRINNVLDGVYENFEKLQKNSDNVIKGSDVLNEKTIQAVDKITALDSHYSKILDVMNVSDKKKK